MMKLAVLVFVLSFVVAAAKNDLATSVGGSHIARWTLPQDVFTGECDLVLVNAKDFHNGAGLALHVRTTLEPSSSSSSYMERAAVRVGEHVLEVLPDKVYLNGVQYDPSESEQPLRFTNGNYHYHYKLIKEETKDTRVFRLDLGGWSAIEFSFYKQFLTVSTTGTIHDFGNAVGMLGNYHDGSMWSRSGEPFTQSFEKYAFEWQVDPREDGQLFRQARAPQLPLEQCRMPSEPKLFQRNLRALRN
mmetsp:Transcript_4378/g.9033  ORF Transcript_4378/g.9033 Transcript_4378/m.9033 type:complete len:245 (-) Transcript_4378:148-882(-)